MTAWTGRSRSALLVCAVFAWAFAFQGSRGLWEPDEGRYVAIAAQMLHSGDFITPAFNDETVHFAKPPLTYWAIAGGMSLLGWNEWGARLANALAFAATVLVLHALAKRITPRRPWLPPLVYAGFPLTFLGANMVTTDTLLALFEALAVLGFVAWRERPDRSRAGLALWLMWTGFALAFLTKGPPALLPLLVILAFVALTDGRRAVRSLASAPGIATFAAVGVGWYALVVASRPGLASYFLRDEVWRRISTASAERNPQWYGAIVVYVPTLLLGTLPWTAGLLRAMRSAPRLVSRAWWRTKLQGDPWTAFLALWVLLPLVVLCVSRSRLPLYLLPLCAPLALGLGKLLPERPLGRAGVALVSAWFVLLVGVRGAAALYPYERSSVPISRAIGAGARSIAVGAGASPSEIVFVDSKPVWGVSLYLRCEVERVALVDAPATDEPRLETLESELSDSEPGTVLVVPKNRQAETAALLDRLGRPARELGRFGSLLLLAPTPPLVVPAPDR